LRSSEDHACEEITAALTLPLALPGPLYLCLATVTYRHTPYQAHRQRLESRGRPGHSGRHSSRPSTVRGLPPKPEVRPARPTRDSELARLYRYLIQKPGSRARRIPDTKANLKHASRSISVAEAIGDVIQIVVLQGVLGDAPRVRVGSARGSSQPSSVR